MLQEHNMGLHQKKLMFWFSTAISGPTLLFYYCHYHWIPQLPSLIFIIHFEWFETNLFFLLLNKRCWRKFFEEKKFVSNDNNVKRYIFLNKKIVPTWDLVRYNLYKLTWEITSGIQLKWNISTRGRKSAITNSSVSVLQLYNRYLNT